jgi:2-polyprenyl-6-methoxyphenol hydroxylase-like FAD-dependent oxidoreductase
MSDSQKGDYELASPCSMCDLPQTLLEPVLIRRATNEGFKVRFDTSLLSFSQDAATGTITAQLRDHVSNLEYEVRTKYLFGADGAQSRVVKELELPMIGKAPQGVALNVLVKADLSHLMGSRMGNLHCIMQPDREHPDFAFMCIARMVKPWHEWMFILFPTKEFDINSQPSDEAYMQRVRDFIGDDTPAEILNISKWFINEVVAAKYSVNNV